MIPADVTQGTAAWHQLRLGRATASRVKDALDFKRNGEESQARANYRMQLVAERLSGLPTDHFVSPFMQRCTEREPFARAAYEDRMNVLVEQVGFIIHPQIEQAGASPDGCLDDDGLIEIKAPQITTHLATMSRQEAPIDYIPQMQWQMACTGRKWCDFVSFCPELPLRHQLFVKRVKRDDALIAEMEAGVRQFLAEIDEAIARLNELNAEIAMPAPAAEDYGDLGITDEDLDRYLPITYEVRA